MAEDAVSAAGYHVIWGTQYLGEVVDPKIPKRTLNMVDKTTHDSLIVNNNMETKAPGIFSMSEGSVRIYYTGTTAQDGLETDFRASTARDCWFIRPSGGALAGKAYRCTAVISAMDEPIDKKGNVTWDIAITPTSDLTPVSTWAAGLTTPFFSIGDDDSPTPNTITPSPVAAAAVYAYNAELYADNSTFKITPTAAVGTIYVNGVLVASGAASSTIPAPDAGKYTYVSVVVYETNKTPKPYLIRLKKGSVTKP